MKRRQFREKLCMLLFLVSTIAVSACSGNGLRSESIKSFYSDYRGTDSMICVVPDRDSTLPEGIDQQYWTQALGSVDFSEYFVVFVFRGMQPVWSNTEFQITSVVENDREVHIATGVVVRTANSAVSEFLSPTEAIKIEKGRMHRYGEITFRLVDESGKEMASTTAVISP